jgi:hypothetical protein
MGNGLILYWDIITSKSPPYSSLRSHDYVYHRKLFGNEKGAKQMHADHAECSDDDDMVAMERQLAARAARASRSEDPPPSTRRQSEPVAERQELPAGPQLPLPDQSPTPESPPAHATASKDDQLIPPASPSTDILHARKRKRPAAASPEHPPTPENSVHSRKRNDVLQPLENIFDDDSPLTEEEEVTQPAKRTRKGGRAQPKKPQRSSTRKSRK